MQMIMKLYEILNMIKGFTVSYTTKNNSSFIIDYNDRRYKVTLEEIKESSNEALSDIEKYLES